MTSPEENDSRKHPGGELVAAYVERKLTEEEKAAFEKHLDGCAECRREVVEVTRFLRSEDRSARRWRVLPLTAVAAAALLLLVLWPGGPADSGDRRGDALRERPGSGGGIPAIVAVRPSGEAALAADSIAFTWRSVDPEAFYRLTVTTEEGRVVWRAETADTSLVPPLDSGLASGGAYYWFVDALLPDGREATTGVRRFSVRP